MPSSTPYFYPRSPCGERLSWLAMAAQRGYISIHALLAESDFNTTRVGVSGKLFLSTLSLRRATAAPSLPPGTWHDFYPRSPCGERPNRPHMDLPQFKISIHALLAESDCCTASSLAAASLFLSTLSLRRATAWDGAGRFSYRNFYPRSPCGERLFIFGYRSIGCWNFYPRSPCGERPEWYERVVVRGEFLSTLSLRRATALLSMLTNAVCHFYPRSPCGERRGVASSMCSTILFLSTLSLRRATCASCQEHCNDKQFLSTLSLRRATIFSRKRRSQGQYFYPRSPCGERRH